MTAPPGGEKPLGPLGARDWFSDAPAQPPSRDRAARRSALVGVLVTLAVVIAVAALAIALLTAALADTVTVFVHPMPPGAATPAGSPSATRAG